MTFIVVSSEVNSLGIRSWLIQCLTSTMVGTVGAAQHHPFSTGRDKETAARNILIPATRASRNHFGHSRV